jgi:hypothetical protein
MSVNGTNAHSELYLLFLVIVDDSYQETLSCIKLSDDDDATPQLQVNPRCSNCRLINSTP